MGNASERFRKALDARLKAGELSKTELHQRTKIGRSVIDRYLKGTTPGLDHAEKIAKAFGISLGEFIGDVTTLPPRAPDVLGAIEIMGALRAERKAGVDGPISKRLFEQIAEIEGDGD